MNKLLSLFHTRSAVFLHDLAMVPVAWLGAYWLRFNLDYIPPVFWRQTLLVLPIVMLVQGVMFWYFGLYRGVWRFASLPDLMRVVKAVSAGVVIAAAALFIVTRLYLIPRSIFVLDAILLVLLLGGPRFLYRLVKDRHLYARAGKKVLIVGAGQAGEMLVRDLLRDPERLYQPCAFADDHPRKQGKDIHGVPVAGTCDVIPVITVDYAIDRILIALPSATSRQMRRIVEKCEESGVAFQILPRMQDLVTGQVSIKELREVKIDDLLGREAVSLDWQAIRQGVRGKTVLVSGGGGSIGSELCRQIARLNPTALVVLEHGEFNLYKIDLELRREYPALQLTSILGDVTDRVAVDKAMRTHRPDVIFHAAAYKHVPMLEDQVRAAARNNVLGTRMLASAAVEHGCEAFVMISTDKAVNPGNIMGVTKRVAEIYCQNLNARSKTRFITVRFGNVLGSTGSVIPLFQAQIAAGGPVTVTHPDITRYFMTIPEAAQLILQAGVMGQGGEIFVLDMGEPVKINYLAEQLIRLSGKRPGEDIEIVYTGLRPGEKMYEELFHDAESLRDTKHPKILLSDSRQVDLDVLGQTLDAIAQACDGDSDAGLRELLLRLVPEHAAHDQKGATIYPWKAAVSQRSDA